MRYRTKLTFLYCNEVFAVLAYKQFNTLKRNSSVPSSYNFCTIAPYDRDRSCKQCSVSCWCRQQQRLCRRHRSLGLRQLHHRRTSNLGSTDETQTQGGSLPDVPNATFTQKKSSQAYSLYTGYRFKENMLDGLTVKLGISKTSINLSEDAYNSSGDSAVSTTSTKANTNLSLVLATTSVSESRLTCTRT